MKSNGIPSVKVSVKPFTLSVPSDSNRGALQHVSGMAARAHADPVVARLRRPGGARVGLERGAIGVTTNPVLVAAALKKRPAAWGDARSRRRSTEACRPSARRSADGDRGHEAAARCCRSSRQPAAQPASSARRSIPVARRRPRGHVRDGQTPSRVGAEHRRQAAGDRRRARRARRLRRRGDHITATVSFTVPQAIAIAERHRAGIARAGAAASTPGKCFAVIMIGRLDDYLREVAHDGQVAVSEAGHPPGGPGGGQARIRDLQGARLRSRAAGGGAARRLSSDRAGRRGPADVDPSAYQEPSSRRTSRARSGSTSGRPETSSSGSQQMPDFVRAYEPDGMTPRDSSRSALTQRTPQPVQREAGKLTGEVTT